MSATPWYLTCEKTAFRASLDISDGTRASVIMTWHCRHPFHGMRLELGDVRCVIEKDCAVWSLPRREPEASVP